jgi:hypothetical protein
MAKEKAKKKEDNRDVFEKILDDEQLFTTVGALAGGALGARLTGGKFGKSKRTFRDFDLNAGSRVLGGGTGAAIGMVGAEVARQKMGGMPAGKKRRK